MRCRLPPGSPLPTLHTDGGANAQCSQLMQFQSDLLQVPVHRSACEDLSASEQRGSGGGLALGWWKDSF